MFGDKLGNICCSSNCYLRDSQLLTAVYRALRVRLEAVSSTNIVWDHHELNLEVIIENKNLEVNLSREISTTQQKLSLHHASMTSANTASKMKEERA